MVVRTSTLFTTVFEIEMTNVPFVETELADALFMLALPESADARMEFNGHGLAVFLVAGRGLAVLLVVGHGLAVFLVAGHGLAVFLVAGHGLAVF